MHTLTQRIWPQCTRTDTHSHTVYMTADRPRAPHHLIASSPHHQHHQHHQHHHLPHYLPCRSGQVTFAKASMAAPFSSLLSPLFSFSISVYPSLSLRLFLISLYPLPSHVSIHPITSLPPPPYLSLTPPFAPSVPCPPALPHPSCSGGVAAPSTR